MTMTYALLHSPLLAASGTWGQVPGRLGDDTVVVEVDTDDALPFADRYVEEASSRIVAAGVDDVTLVAHSGAGPLVAAVVDAVRSGGTRVAGAVFVDAGLPTPGSTRLDLIRAESMSMADELQTLLVGGAAYPDWTAEQIADLVPDPAVVLRALRPRAAAFWSEPLPRTSLASDLALGYVQLSAAYDPHAATARSLGWPVVAADLGHLAMLSAPSHVSELIREVTQGATTIS